jgi:hypothetical protein
MATMGGAKTSGWVPPFSGSIETWEMFKVNITSCLVTAGKGFLRELTVLPRGQWLDRFKLLSYEGTQTEHEAVEAVEATEDRPAIQARAAYTSTSYTSRQVLVAEMEYDKANGILFSLLVLATMTPSVAHTKVREYDQDGIGAWKSLCHHYEEAPGQNAAASYYQELTGLQMIGGEDPEVYVARMRTIIIRLKSIDEKLADIPETFLITILLKGVTSEYDDIREIYQSEQRRNHGG